MKSSTRNVYAQRIDRVVARLQTAIAEGGELPDLGELAGVAHLSPFHFHRIWRALTGETIGATVGRLRLLRALRLLGDADALVGDAAAAAGYESPQALARAFREVLGASPSEFRGDALRIERAAAMLEKPPVDASAPVALLIEVVSVEPFEVVVLRNRGAFADLDGAYGRLFEWAAEAGLVERIAGLHGHPMADHRDAGDALEFDCAIRVTADVAPPAPLRTETWGGGDYARSRHVGDYALLEDVTDALLLQVLDGGGVLRDAPIHYDFLDDPETTPEALLRADVFVPVQRVQ